MSIITDVEMMATDLQGMITPYIGEQVRMDGERKVISYGQGSAGYDIRMAPSMLKFLAYGIVGESVNPKQFDETFLQTMVSKTDETGEYFTIPPHSCILTRSVEEFNIPPFVMATCLGKSTYARCGLIVNVTPLEPGWRGYLTIEISNTTDSHVDVYANEGIAQLIFNRLDVVPGVTYADRNGKYQGQGAEVVTAKG